MKTGTYDLNIAIFKKAEAIADSVLRESTMHIKEESFFKEYGVTPEKSVEAFNRTKRLMALNALRYQMAINEGISTGDESEEHF